MPTNITHADLLLILTHKLSIDSSSTQKAELHAFPRLSQKPYNLLHPLPSQPVLPGEPITSPHGTLDRSAVPPQVYDPNKTAAMQLHADL